MAPKRTHSDPMLLFSKLQAGGLCLSAACAYGALTLGPWWLRAGAVCALAEVAFAFYQSWRCVPAESAQTPHACAVRSAPLPALSQTVSPDSRRAHRTPK